MARVEPVDDVAHVTLEEACVRLTQVSKEAAYVERLAVEVKAERVGPRELPALLENLGARLAQLSSPGSRWRGLPRVAGG